MKKILIINHFAGIPKKNESSMRHFYIAKKFNNNGFDCSIITSKNSYVSNKKIIENEKLFNGVKYFFIDEKNFKKNNLFIKLLRMFNFSFNLFYYLFLNRRKHKVDLVYASSPDLFTCLVSYLYSKSISAKFFLEIRDIWPLSQIEIHNFSRNHPLIFLLTKIEIFLHRKADIVISNLPQYQNYLEDNDINYKRYYHLPQMIDFKYYSSYQAKNLSKNHENIFRSFDNVGIYAGTIGTYYGIEHLINSLRLSNEANDNNLALIIVGSGDFKVMALSLIKKYRIKNIFVIDQVNRSYLSTLLNKSTFAILSFPEKDNLYKYGIASLKMFDYIYYKIPILSIGLFTKYSILKNAKYKFDASFGSIKKINHQFDVLSKLSLEKRNKIGEENFDILKSNFSTDLIDDFIFETHKILN